MPALLALLALLAMLAGRPSGPGQARVPNKHCMTAPARRASFQWPGRGCAVLSASVPGVRAPAQPGAEGGEARQRPSDRVQIQWDNMSVAPRSAP